MGLLSQLVVRFGRTAAEDEVSRNRSCHLDQTALMVGRERALTILLIADRNRCEMTRAPAAEARWSKQGMRREVRSKISAVEV